MSAANLTEDYLEVVERLADTDIAMMEINVSCPNVKEGAIAFGSESGCIIRHHVQD